MATVVSESGRPSSSPPGKRVVVGLWNVQWAAATNAKGRFFAPLLGDLDCDVLCLTEGSADILPAEGHIITSSADYGYGVQGSKRKVMLWSRNPWKFVDDVGSVALPPGRFVAGTTDTSLDPLRFIGVCIPWKDAHVSSGRRVRSPWQDHITYCRHLPEASVSSEVGGSILLGDFNQRVSRQRQPANVYSALVDALAGRFELATAGTIPGAPDLTIDHLAATRNLRSVDVSYLSAANEAGKAMSDHFGLRITLMRASV